MSRAGWAVKRGHHGKIIPNDSLIRVIKNIFQEWYAVLTICHLDPRNQVFMADRSFHQKHGILTNYHENKIYHI